MKAVLVITAPKSCATDVPQPQRIALTSTGPFPENCRKDFLDTFSYAKIRLGHERTGPLEMMWGIYVVGFTLDGRMVRNSVTTAEVTMGFPKVVSMKNALEGTTLDLKDKKFKETTDYIATKSQLSIELTN